MKVEDTIVRTMVAELSQKDIERVLRDHLVNQLGNDWEDAIFSIDSEVIVSPFSLEDKFQTIVSFKIVEVS